jgi:hypothetical protein
MVTLSLSWGPEHFIQLGRGMLGVSFLLGAVKWILSIIYGILALFHFTAPNISATIIYKAGMERKMDMP